MNTLVLGLGSNLGNKKQNLANAINLISSQIGTILKTSDVFETAPWGVHSQENYFNQVIVVHTEILPLALMDKILEMEIQLGRIRTIKWDSRLIDIDILFYNDWYFDTPNLIIPHPFVADRNFVLQPLSQILPDFIHPKHQEKIDVLATRCSDKSWIKILN